MVLPGARTLIQPANDLAARDPSLSRHTESASVRSHRERERTHSVRTSHRPYRRGKALSKPERIMIDATI
jgi:hypothetical protein